MQSKGKVAEWIRTIVGVGVFTFALKTVAFATYYIPSESMVPTLEVGDRLVATKFDYGFGPYSTAFFSLPSNIFDGRLFGRLPDRGDIVIFEHPVTGETLVKRVIGLPGDTIRLDRGRLVINGETAPRRFLRSYAYRQYDGPAVTVKEYAETLPGGETHPIILRSDDEPQENTGTYRVPPDHLFVMGDNRDNSADSRFAEPRLCAGGEPHRPLARDSLFAPQLHAGGRPHLRPAAVHDRAGIGEAPTPRD